MRRLSMAAVRWAESEPQANPYRISASVIVEMQITELPFFSSFRNSARAKGEEPLAMYAKVLVSSK
jgi:hypothetical protein